MKGWLYLIRNRDLYKIGITKKFDNRMRQLKPDYVVAKLYTSDFLKLERELHNKYKKFRIPQTEYFRLEDYHLKEIKQRISKLDYPMSMVLDMFIRSLLFISFIFLLTLLIISLTINDISVVLFNSILLMERISFVFSILSLFVHSRKYLSFTSELKYRLSRLIVYIFFALSFNAASVFFAIGK